MVKLRGQTLHMEETLHLFMCLPSSAGRALCHMSLHHLWASNSTACSHFSRWNMRCSLLNSFFQIQ